VSQGFWHERARAVEGGKRGLDQISASVSANVLNFPRSPCNSGGRTDLRRGRCIGSVGRRCVQESVLEGWASVILRISTKLYLQNKPGG
jgi:hypothetical protein